MENSARQQEEKRNLFTGVSRLLKTGNMFDEGIPVKVLPKILFLVVLVLFYIGNTHYAERTIRKIEKLKVHVEDLRADYTTLKADLMFSSKQSEVAKRVEPIGLQESMKAPYIISVDPDEY